MGKKKMTSVVYKGHMKAHSKYRDQLTNQLDKEEANLAETANVPAYNAANLSIALGLHPDELDQEEPDEKLEQQLTSTNEALTKMKQIMRAIEPILFDLKDGSLKRVKKSNFVRVKNGIDEIGAVTMPSSPTPNESIMAMDDVRGLLIAVSQEQVVQDLNMTTHKQRSSGIQKKHAVVHGGGKIVERRQEQNSSLDDYDAEDRSNSQSMGTSDASNDQRSMSRQVANISPVKVRQDSTKNILKTSMNQQKQRAMDKGEEEDEDEETESASSYGNDQGSSELTSNNDQMIAGENRAKQVNKPLAVNGGGQVGKEVTSPKHKKQQDN